MYNIRMYTCQSLTRCVPAMISHKEQNGPQCIYVFILTYFIVFTCIAYVNSEQHLATLPQTGILDS